MRRPRSFWQFRTSDKIASLKVSDAVLLGTYLEDVHHIKPAADGHRHAARLLADDQQHRVGLVAQGQGRPVAHAHVRAFRRLAQW